MGKPLATACLVRGSLLCAPPPTQHGRVNSFPQHRPAHTDEMAKWLMSNGFSSWVSWCLKFDHYSGALHTGTLWLWYGYGLFALWSWNWPNWLAITLDKEVTVPFSIIWANDLTSCEGRIHLGIFTLFFLSTSVWWIDPAANAHVNNHTDVSCSTSIYHCYHLTFTESITFSYDTWVP